MFIASNIRYLRTKRGLTQMELARELEKTSAAVSDYEKAKSIPPLDVTYRICTFFEVKIDDLVRKDLRKEDYIIREGLRPYPDDAYQARYEQATKELQRLERISQLQELRLAELEREIKEHAPELAARLGLIAEE